MSNVCKDVECLDVKRLQRQQSVRRCGELLANHITRPHYQGKLGCLGCEKPGHHLEIYTLVLPFVVEHAGALGKDADKFFHAIVKKVRNELNASEEAESSWSSRGFSNFYYQRISVANLKGLGHLFLVAEALLRSAGNVPFGS